MHAPEATQIGPQPCPSAFAAVAMDLPHAIRVVIAGPLLLPVLHASVPQLQLLPYRPVASPFIGIQRRCSHGNAAGQDLSAGGPVRVLADEVAHLAAAAADERKDRRPIGSIGTVPPDLFGAPGGGLGG